MSDDDIRWEDPPPDLRGRYADADSFRQQLRKNPGDWAFYPNSKSVSTSMSMKEGRGGWAPKGAFEAVTRTVDGEKAIYVRYVGDS